MTAIVSMPPPNVQQQTEPPPPPDGNTVILRQEVWGPTEELASNSRYVYRMPKGLTWDEIVFDAAEPGGLLVTVQVLVAGVTLFTSPKQMTGPVLRVPKAQWRNTYQSGAIPVDAQVTITLAVSPGGVYSTPWFGLALAFVKS